MNPNPVEFRSGVISPVECLKEGWQLIKDRYWLFLGISLVAMLVGGAVPVVLIGPMMVGLYMCLFAKMRGEPVEFGMLFKGFDYFMQGLVAAAIQTLPVILIMAVGQVIFVAFTLIIMPTERGEMLPPVFWVALVLFVLFVMIVSLAVHSLFLFAYPLIADRNLSGLEAIKLSYRAALKNLGGIIGLILLISGLSILGVLACYVGAFLVMPISFASYAVAYRRVFPETGSLGGPAPPPPPGSWAA
ncbi:MAG: hypothetical protein ACXWID_14350 [Pyrinomonadaceae bacterium]